jgi:hypothetical protein
MNAGELSKKRVEGLAEVFADHLPIPPLEQRFAGREAGWRRGRSGNGLVRTA